MILYHGSPTQNLTELDSSFCNSVENLEGEGLYFTTDYNLAKDYALVLNEIKEGSVYSVEVDDTCLLDLTTIDAQDKFFKIISEKTGYDLKSHDNYGIFSNFLDRKGSRNGIGTLADDVVDVLKMTPSVNSYDIRQGKTDIRSSSNFPELCKNIYQAITDEIAKYELFHFRVDAELVYVLKRSKVKVLSEQKVRKNN